MKKRYSEKVYKTIRNNKKHKKNIIQYTNKSNEKEYNDIEKLCKRYKIM